MKALKRFYEEFRSLCWDINGKFRETITVSTKQGMFTVLIADRGISRSLYCYRQYELESISRTMGFLRSKHKCPPKGEGTIVDIGANNGVISIGALHTGELERAIAIEPDPQNFSLLEHNVILNGLQDRVICLPYAVSNQKGEVPFELSETNFGDHRIRTSSPRADSDSADLYHESGRHVTRVQSDQLDGLLANLPELFTHNIALIWIDVQGYEGYAFMGAKNVLSRGIPVVSEIWPYGIRRAGLTQNQFCEIARSMWADYWIWRRGKFVRYPIHTLDILFDELGYDGACENAVFTQ